MRVRAIRSAIYLAGGLGLIVAIFTYLETIEASLQSLCSITAFVSCGAVAHSGKTTVFGIDDSYIGIGGFVLILLVAGISEIQPGQLLWPHLLLLLTTTGVAFSLYFAYVELVEIRAICYVCLAAWTLGFVAWGGTLALVRRVREQAPSPVPAGPGGADRPGSPRAPPDEK